MVELLLHQSNIDINKQDSVSDLNPRLFVRAFMMIYIAYYMLIAR